MRKVCKKNVKEFKSKKDNATFLTQKKVFKTVDPQVDYILQLQKSIGNQAVHTLFTHKLIHVKRQTRTPGSLFIQRQESKADQAKRLKDINDAARKTAKIETKVSTAKPHWAKTLSPTHITNLSRVLKYLKTAITDLTAGSKKIDKVKSKLYNAINTITEVKKKVNRFRVKGYGEFSAIIEFKKVKNGVDAAEKLLKESKAKGINGLDVWIKKVNTLSAELKKAELSFITNKSVNLTVLDTLHKTIKKVRSDFMKIAYKFKDFPVAAKKIQFVIRYFMALNSSSFSNTPTLKKATDIRTKLGAVTYEMALIFGGKSSDYELFGNFETQLRQQIWIRSEMKKASGTDPGLKPSESDIKKYFISLKKSSNTDVINAYRQFASGYFIHREEANPAVLAAKQTLRTLFALPVTISGARLITCSGYAVLGKTLLQNTGARFKKYYIGIRVSDYQIKCSSKYKDVHALAHLTRKDPSTKAILNMYVSNNNVVFKKNDGLGPTAVAWFNSANPLYEGNGATIASAIQYAINRLAAKRKTLSHITCK